MIDQQPLDASCYGRLRLNVERLNSDAEAVRRSKGIELTPLREIPHGRNGAKARPGERCSRV